jgi:hypothetical protein
MHEPAPPATASEDRGGRFLIVGAGFCGLGVAAALRRHQIAFDCVDAADEIGGNWYHGVYDGAHIISSRRTTEYGDYPMPADWPDFPSAAQMLDYLHRYAAHWDLRRSIELKTRVEWLEPAQEGPDESWRVRLEGDRERRYRGVVIANGHHWDRRFPRYPGELSGEIIHSKDYKCRDQLVGRRVLVIGGGNSACDIVVEAARVARTAHLSLRRGYWFLPKTLFGRPTVEFIRPYLPVAVQRAFVRTALRVVVGRYEDYGLPYPDHRIFDKHPTINTELLHAIRHGRISPHPDVARWDGELVEFIDGVRVPIDLVVCATGYHGSIPFIDPEIVPFSADMPQLVGGLFHARFRNLYVFGFGQPRYGAGPLISAGAETVACAIETQPRLAHPIGALLRRLGQGPPRRAIADPMAVLRRARFARALLPRLPWVESMLMPGGPAAASRPSAVASAAPSPRA